MWGLALGAAAASPLLIAKTRIPECILPPAVLTRAARRGRALRDFGI